MPSFKSLLTLPLLATTALALPTLTSRASSAAAGTVLAVMPLSSSCSGRGTQCATADTAAPYLVDAMDTYGVKTGIEQAGILALIAYESGELQYRINTNAAEAATGKGTSNQQMGTFNVEFANTIPALKAMNLDGSTVLDQVTKDEYNFATGAWFYSSQDTCTDARAMATNGTTAWDWYQNYITACVGTTFEGEPGRITYWNNALEAFGITNTTSY